MIDPPDISWVRWFERDYWIWLIAIAAIVLGIWHFSMSIRCLVGRAAPITVSHHLLHLFSPVALLFLGMCAGPAIAPRMIPPGDVEGALAFLVRFPVFFGVIGLCVFIPNLFLALFVIARNPHNQTKSNS